MKIRHHAILLSAVTFLFATNPYTLAHTDVTAQQAKDLIDSTPDLTVVDVREQYEYCSTKGHIPGALNYPWSSGVLETRYEELPTDRPILVVCASGGRSNAAATFLDSKGFTMIYDMLRGMSVWKWETAPCKYSGGSGTPEDPYQIATAEDLITLGETTEDYDKHFILTADIDLDPNLPGRKVFDSAVIAPDTNDAHWDFDGIPFTGVFYGNGHLILHLSITGESYLGLFGLLGGGEVKTEVRKLGMVDVSISGRDYVGGLAGKSRYDTVSQCYSTGSVSGNGYIGGLVGYKGGVTNQCYSTVAVLGDRTGQSYGGGIGGLVGENHGTITHCYSIGSVMCNGPDSTSHSVSIVGGLVGRNSMLADSWASVINSFWDIDTSGQIISEGGIGKTTAEMQTYETFIAWGTCGTEGIWTINDGNDYPRLCWENKPGELIEHAPLSDFLTGTGIEDDPFLIYEAEQLNLIGLFPCEWDKHFKLMADIDMSGFDGKDGRPQFNIIAPGHVAGFEEVLEFRGTPFTGIFDGDGHKISHLTIEADTCGGLFGGLGTNGEVRKLGVTDVNIIDCDYVGGLVGFSEEGASVIQCYSTGTISGWYAGGLLSRNTGNITTSYSTVMVGGNGLRIGGLVGDNQGSITQSYSAGTASGFGAVGGFVGVNGGNINTSYCIGVASGNLSIGGLVGVNRGNIAKSYSTGEVNGGGSVGGLVGLNEWDSYVTQCYSISKVIGNKFVGGLIGSEGDGPTIVLQSVWDVETSGQATSAGGTGKTAAEMQTASTFLDAGWDFVDETTNGTDDIWWILEGQDYPRLWWETQGN